MKRPDSATISIIVCFFIIVVLSFSLIFVLGERKMAEAVDVSPLQDLAETIHSQYYFYDDKKLDGEKLVDSAMRGMITSLDDPYAQYFTEEEYNQLLTANSGDYVGLGISLQVSDDVGSMVINVYSGGPADLAGLRKGDVITKVNGTVTANLSLDALIGCFSDDEDVPDEITFLRDGIEKTIRVQRTEVHIKRVDSKLLSDNIGYIRITEFNGSVAEDFVSAAKELQGKGVRNLIIDLRDNPGGGLNEVLGISNTLIPEGNVIVSIRSKSGDERVYKSEGGEQFGMKLVVLVNGYSASASELLTGALKDYGLATIIGTQTFGKGIVQSFFHISENGGWAKMTTDAYYTPNDVCIQGVGISPDLVVELPEELKDTAIDFIDPAKDTQLQAAIGVFAQQASLPAAVNR